ncbi:hypothetical protein, partial [Streptomyces sp. S5]|uniref:hypothetical protein n=1 Tax=Streptomyces sp. S5 TaxID=1456735 RepID=UPI00196A075B
RRVVDSFMLSAAAVVWISARHRDDEAPGAPSRRGRMVIEQRSATRDGLGERLRCWASSGPR